MKFIFAALLITFSYAAQARSLYNGPLLVKTLGNPETDDTWKVCTIKSTSVTISLHSKGTNPIHASEGAQFDSDKLKTLIRAASTAKTWRGAFVREQVPNIKIEAAIVPQLEAFTLYAAASHPEGREGAEVDELLSIVRDHCGTVK